MEHSVTELGQAVEAADRKVLIWGLVYEIARLVLVVQVVISLILLFNNHGDKGATSIVLMIMVAAEFAVGVVSYEKMLSWKRRLLHASSQLRQLIVPPPML